MLLGLTRRLLGEVDARLLYKFAYNFGWKGMRAVQRFEKRRKAGEYFPAFVFTSVTNNCNLSCQGCWITVARPPAELPPETLHRVIVECKRRGSFLFGILGGEPLLYRGLLEIMARHPDAYFLLFTNGTVINEETARQMRRLGNVSPLVSVEGSAGVSDTRRGGRDVYERTLRGLDHCRRHRLVTGVATSVCRSNIDDLVSEAFVRELIGRGVHYLWYYIYRPVGANPAPELALTREQILRLRRFMVDIRTRAPIIVVDAYWDHLGRALCPAATGISHHIGPAGDLEPCPPIQFSTDHIGDGSDLGQRFAESRLLSEFRARMRQTTRGCVLLEDPALLAHMVAATGARNTSGRNNGLAELEAMRPCPGHDLGADAIPEKHWLYRFAKKHWFFGFGAYG